MTFGDAADGVIVAVTGLNPSDDIQVDKEYVMYLLSQVRDSSAKQYLDKAVQAGMPIDSAFIIREIKEVVSVEDASSEIDDEDERVYVELTKRPLDIIGDRGVVEVTTDEKIQVLKAQMQNITMFRDLKFAKPTAANLVYYRHDKKIIIEGVSEKNKDADQYIVDYVPALASETLTYTDSMVMPEALLPGVTDMVIKMLADQMGFPMDKENDGVPPAK